MRNISHMKGSERMRMFTSGDTHGLIDIGKLSERNFYVQKYLTKEDYLVVLGDFAAPWFGDIREGEPYIPEGYIPHPMLMKKWGSDAGLLDNYENSLYTTLYIDGNHENHKLLNHYPISEWHGGKVHFIRPSVIHLMRGQVYEFDGNTIFTMGGATSTDRTSRIVDYTWFEEEIPTDEEYDEAMVNLEKHNFEVDFVFSHCCSNRMLYKLAPEYYVTHGFHRDRLTDFFDELEDRLVVRKRWLFGHHHMDKIIDDKHMILYNDIIELDLD